MWVVLFVCFLKSIDGNLAGGVEGDSTSAQLSGCPHQFMALMKEDMGSPDPRSLKASILF